MKKWKCLVSCLFLILCVQSQHLDIPCIYKNDNSYLKLNKYLAEFKIYNSKKSFDYIVGYGKYYIKDSIININTY